MMKTTPLQRKSRIYLAILATTLVLGACGGGSGDAGDTRNAQQDATLPSSSLELKVRLPQRMMNLGIPLDVIVTVAGTERLMSNIDDLYSLDVKLPLNRDYPVFVAVKRTSDKLLLASAETKVRTDADVVPFAVPEQLFNTDFDSDSDGFSNVAELERGSEPLGVSEDFDGDGIANETDHDDDNDGVADAYDAFPLDANETTDTDGDGKGDNLDRDDDNDNILDVDDKFPLDANESLDLDLDGLGNSVDLDDDGDGTIDLEDPQPSNPNITGNEDSDGDGFRDLEDMFPYDPSEHNDADGDGIGDTADPDDDNNGIPDNQDNAVVGIPFSTRTPTIDGAYGWWEWSDAARSDSKVNYLKIDHLMIDTKGTLTDGSNTGGYSSYWKSNYWRAKHDGTYLYVLIVVKNEPFFEHFSDSSDVWHDDAVDLYFDTGNEKGSKYDSNDYHRLFRYDFNAADRELDGYYSAKGMESYYRTSRAMEMANQSQSIYELRIRLSSIGLDTEQRFGFDVHINDDDDGGERDAKWGWYAPSGQDESWNNPSLLGTAALAPRRAANVD